MIVRTAPVILPAPDAMRAMERLEAQLRRAADDLAETLSAMRREHEALAEAEVAAEMARLAPPDGTLCGHWMPRMGEPCARFAGHSDHHRSRQGMDRDRDRQRAGRR